MAVTQPEGFMHRAPRPLILWGGVLLVVLGAVGFAAFLYRIGTAIADAYERAAQTGADVPNMDGGLPALITAVVGFLGMVMPYVMQAMSQRHSERRDQIARGSAPVPFPQPAPSSEPSVDGPRPGDSP